MTRLLGDPLDLAFLPRLPPGWRPEDVIGESRRQRYLPLAKAAALMELDADRVLELVDSGALQALEEDGRLYVEPAIVTGGRVRDVDARHLRLG